jgi:hypothetical protein
MQRMLMVRFWIESTLAAASAFLAVLTLVWPDWIEGIFGVDPDGGSGALEWAIVAALMSTALVATMLARADLRRAQAR